MQHIIQHLFRVDTLEEVTRERLEELVTTYPSFPVGRYLLSRKLQTEQADHFSEETQRTNLYFTNPFWLQWLLQNETSGQKSAGEQVAGPVYEPAAEPVYTAASDQVYVPVGEPLIDEQSWGMPDPADEAGDAETRGTNHEPVIVEEPGAAEELKTGENPEAAEELKAAAEELTATAENGTAPVQDFKHTNEDSIAAPLSAAESLLRQLDEARELRQALVQMNEEPADAARVKEAVADETMAGQMVAKAEPGRVEENAQDGTETPVTAETPDGTEIKTEIEKEPRAEEMPVETKETDKTEEIYGERDTTGIEGAEALAEGEDAIGDGSEQEEASSAAMLEGIHKAGAEQFRIAAEGSSHPEAPESSALRANGSEARDTDTAPQTAGTASHIPGVADHTAEAQSTERSGPTVGPGEPIVIFEPYHTIDYFASVGIKFIQDENPSDKLGKQLKSFTEWLKVMRKLPQKNQEIIPDGAAEHQIQAIAAHSITGKEVVTETMAEVLLKQGMREKAMEVYHKLSLLNPEKSAYFANKIEQLKID